MNSNFNTCATAKQPGIYKIINELNGRVYKLYAGRLNKVKGWKIIRNANEVCAIKNPNV